MSGQHRDGPHALYRFYDDADTLLYVGITLNPGQRWANHREEKAWWYDVATIRTERHDSRADALAAEKEAILGERPLHNVTHNPQRGHMPPRAGEPRVVWLCNECNQPVEGAAGYVHIDLDAVSAHEEAWARFQETHQPGRAYPMSDLLDLPRRPDWQVHHASCDPHQDRSDYSFEVATIDTQRKVIDWAAHMFNKTWITATEWDRLLYRSIGGPAWLG